MNRENLAVIAAVKDFKDAQGLTSAKLAELLFMAPSTLNSKLCGARRWTARDKRLLASIGVRLPKGGAR